MKTNKFYLLAALTGGFTLSLTSCSNDDNPVQDLQTYTTVVSFENKTLNESGFWIGEVNENGFENGYGTSYPCTYEEGGAVFNTTYSVYYWSGFAISNRTETGFDAQTPGQYNNVTGTAHTGSNFCVVQTYGETIDINGTDGGVVKGLWFTNSSYPVNSILNGDTYSGPKFDATDWLTCTIIGTHADGTTASVDLELAKAGDYVKDWQYADLTSLGKVTSLAFSFSGSRMGDWGLNTPAYICIDDVTVEIQK